MDIDRQPPLFEDRTDAGRCLAAHLRESVSKQPVIVGIARGGVQIAAAVAEVLGLLWTTLVVRKLPVPWYPQAGFGAVAADGSAALNESMLCSLGMTEHDVEQVTTSMQDDAARQAANYALHRLPADLRMREVVIVDDVMISGYTMLSAVKSARAQQARSVAVAVPVASRHAATLVEGAADELMFEVVSPSVPFSASDFYLHWRQLQDEDIIPILRRNHDRP